MDDGKCDLCGQGLVVADSAKYSPEQMRAAVRSGLRNKAAARAMEKKLGVPADFSDQSLMTLVNANQNEWVICGRCLPDLRSYLPG